MAVMRRLVCKELSVIWGKLDLELKRHRCPPLTVYGFENWKWERGTWDLQDLGFPDENRQDSRGGDRG